MHIIHGEHGDVAHSHHHEHEHENGCCCGHDHDHDHGHCHEHGHDHGHCHDHEGGCCCHKEQDETLALLTYMLDHNVHHAAELEAVAADMIDKGVMDFQTANMRLKVALSMLAEA